MLLYSSCLFLPSVSPFHFRSHPPAQTHTRTDTHAHTGTLTVNRIFLSVTLLVFILTSFLSCCLSEFISVCLSLGLSPSSSRFPLTLILFSHPHLLSPHPHSAPLSLSRGHLSPLSPSLLFSVSSQLFSLLGGQLSTPHCAPGSSRALGAWCLGDTTLRFLWHLLGGAGVTAFPPGGDLAVLCSFLTSAIPDSSTEPGAADTETQTSQWQLLPLDR